MPSNFVFKKAQRATKSASLLVALPGGPGQIATEVFLPLSPLLEELNRSYDLLIFNPRGTTAPERLLCPQEDPHDLARNFDRRAGMKRAEDCLRSLGRKFDLNNFGTDDAARDLDAIRIRLGYDKITFYGISYGTRLALRYTALFPAHVDRLVLEGVLPPEAVIGQDTDFFDPAIKGLFRRCREQPACRQAFPRFEAEFQELMARLRSPRSFTVKHPLYGDTQTITLDAAQFKHLLQSLLYSEYDADLVPSLVHDAHAGDLSPLVASSVRNHRESVAEGLYFAVSCREDLPFLRPGPLTDNVEELKEICASHAFTKPEDSVHAPLKGDWPILLLSGELDPVTSPSLLKDFKQGLTHAEHLVIPGQGHNVFYLHCAMKRIVKFLALKPDASGQDQPCTDEALPIQVRGGQP